MSLVQTRIQNWRVNTPDFDKNMYRPQQYGALDFFVSQTDSGATFITPELAEKAAMSIGTTVQIPVINYDGDVTISNVRQCTIEDSENTSALYNVVFATFATGFTMVPAMYMNNEISMQRDWERKMEKHIRSLGNALDMQAITALEASKSQVFKDTLIYDVVGNSFVIPWDLREEILADLEPMFKANDYTGQLHLIGNAGVESMLKKLEQKGLYNEVNKQNEAAGKVVHFTNNMLNETGVYASALVVESGNVGYLVRHGREHLMGTRTPVNGREWDIVNMPVLNLPFDSIYYETVGDQSGIAGAATADMTCNLKEHYGFAIDIAFITSYNSDPSEVANPITKFEIQRSNAANPVARPVTIVNGSSNPVYTQAVV